jgi:SAM-dependent methyltransferase
VLEIGCGTGRDSIHIAGQLKKGEFFIQDLSGHMVRKCRDNMRKYGSSVRLGYRLEFFVGNASYLPFADGFFDAVFHFGGVNEFSEKERTIEEMARVVRIGGKVVFGDESMAPWLRNTEYGKILMNNNRLLEHEIPINLLPENARDVRIRWILGNSFYLIDFSVGEGTPPINLDLPHKGVRGGTCRTRYFGQLEGVTLKTKELAEQAAREAGLSMHDWLEKTVRENAENVLEKRK